MTYGLLSMTQEKNERISESVQVIEPAFLSVALTVLKGGFFVPFGGLIFLLLPVIIATGGAMIGDLGLRELLRRGLRDGLREELRERLRIGVNTSIL